MSSPNLKTQRLLLASPLMHDTMDLGHHLKWLCNESVVKYSEQRHIQHDEQTQYAYLCSFDHKASHFWEINRDGIIIGSITAYRDHQNRTANVGVMIGETRLWGQGYAPEAWEAVCNYLFETGCRKIEAGCMASNAGMISLLRKVGFNFEGSLSSHFLLNGKPEDMEFYGKFSQAKIIPLKKTESLPANIA